MRVTSMMAGLALVVAACGGEKAADNQATTTPPADAAAPAAGGAQATTGATHDVNMVLEGTNYRFVPANLTVKAGDVVRFHNKSGGPHNVEFYPDSIPSGAAPVLDANMPDRMGPLAGPLLAEPDAVYQVSFAGAPAGEYKYFCLPHHALGMVGAITVQ
jgi:plastocyanin